MQVYEETAIFGYYSIKAITDVFDNVMFSNSDDVSTATY